RRAHHVLGSQVLLPYRHPSRGPRGGRRQGAGPRQEQTCPDRYARTGPRDGRTRRLRSLLALVLMHKRGEQIMAGAKIAPNLPDWMIEHVNRYVSSGGHDGHMYKMTQPGRPEMTVPSLLLTTKGRTSGERFIFPLFYGEVDDSYFVVASKGGAPQHP